MNTSTTDPASQQPKYKPRRWRKRILIAISLLLLLTPIYAWIYNQFAQHRLQQEIETGDRDPDTGILRGADAITLPGEKNAVLMLHGYLGTRQDFNHLEDPLQAMGLTVRMIRFPGHGTRPDDFATVTPDELLQHARQEYQALAREHDTVHVIGFSMGASIAMQLAAEGISGKLVLISPYFRVTHKWYYLLTPERWQHLTTGWFPYVVRNEFFIKVNRRDAIPHIIAYRVIPSSGIDTLIQLGATASDPDLLQKIKGEVLILHSTGDEAADPAASRDAAEAMSNADCRYQSYEDSNHILMWDYDAAAAKQEIIDYLSQGE